MQWLESVDAKDRVRVLKVRKPGGVGIRAYGVRPSPCPAPAVPPPPLRIQSFNPLLLGPLQENSFFVELSHKTEQTQT